MKKLTTLKNRKTLISFLILCLLSHNNRSLAQAGTLDVSFGKGGKVVTNFNYSIDHNSIVCIDSSGRICLAPDTLLIRYLSNGNLDSSFGINGVQSSILTRQSSSYYYGIPDNHAVLIQSDGKIIITGTCDSAGFTGFEVVRYKPNGILDSAFGINGKQVTNFRFNSYCDNATLQPDGKILLIGSTQSDSTASAFVSFALVRLQTNGKPDSTFGINGQQIISFEGKDDIGYAVAVQKDGKIVVTGEVEIPIDPFSNLDEFGLVRLLANGQLDSAFGINGKQFTALGDAGATAVAVMIQHDNKIVVVGSSFTFGVKVHSDFALVRYQTNGSIDSSFGINGKQIINFGSNTIANSATLQPDEKIIIAGDSTDFLNTASDFALARYLSDGTLDSSFGANGLQVTHFDGGSHASSVALQQDGKIVVFGTTYPSISFYSSIALVRYNNYISLPVILTSFIAVKAGKSVLLKWQTATELNNNYFSVERSSNGIAFKEIGKVISKGNSDRGQEYIFSDFAPLLNSNYYRLKQVDKNGHSIYSKAVLVNFDEATNIKLYPNPVRDKFIVEGLNKSTKSTLTIIDVHGRVVQTAVSISDNYLWNLKMLPAGGYYLQINSGNKNSTFKFIKE